MQELRLDNRILIVSHIKQYCDTNSLDYVSTIEEMYATVIEEVDSFIHLDNIVESLKEKLGRETIYDTEEELFHVISVELDDIYTNEIINNADPEHLSDVFEFLNENYYDIFKNYYEKKGYISDDDYDECVLTIFNNYDMDEEVADILVGKFIVDNVITPK